MTPAPVSVEAPALEMAVPPAEPIVPVRFSVPAELMFVALRYMC